MPTAFLPLTMAFVLTSRFFHAFGSCSIQKERQPNPIQFRWPSRDPVAFDPGGFLTRNAYENGFSHNLSRTGFGREMINQGILPMKDRDGLSDL